MENNGQDNKDFVQPERNYYEQLFTRRAENGQLPFQTAEEYMQEMQEIEGALREIGEDF